jgi:peptidoglycan/LPS O-acetylase OafA/YrhL
MFGSFRLFLAIMVALSHAGVRFGGLNPGVSAVVGFYLVSGYVMTGLLRRHYSTLDAAPRFYLDRALRLYPQYLAIAALTLLWLVLTGSRNDFLQHAPGAVDLFNNLLIVPLNYLFGATDRLVLIPPAWSLGAELQFYLLFPFILLPRAGRALILPLSLVLYLCAAWGAIESERYGYRLLPGVLFMFLLGSWLHDLHVARRSRAAAVLVIVAVLGAALLAAVLWRAGRLELPYNRETLLGLALGAPALHLLSRQRRRPWDEALGDLSYGVFLAHFLVLWTVLGRVENGRDIALFLGLSCLVAHATQRLVERPALALRRRLRRRPTPQPSP